MVEIYHTWVNCLIIELLHDEWGRNSLIFGREKSRVICLFLCEESWKEFTFKSSESNSRYDDSIGISCVYIVCDIGHMYSSAYLSFNFNEIPRFMHFSRFFFFFVDSIIAVRQRRCETQSNQNPHQPRSRLNLVVDSVISFLLCSSAYSTNLLVKI